MRQNYSRRVAMLLSAGIGLGLVVALSLGTFRNSSHSPDWGQLILLAAMIGLLVFGVVLPLLIVLVTAVENLVRGR